MNLPKKTKYVSLLVFSLSFFVFGQQINAQTVGGCFTPSNGNCQLDTGICVNEGRNYGIAGANYACMQDTGQCCLGIGWNNGSLEKFQKDLIEDDKNKTVSFNTFLGGPEGIVSGLIRTSLTAIAGPVPSVLAAYQPGGSSEASGAIGVVANLIGSMYSKPPATTYEYLADLGRSFGIAKPAYAQQGIGFGGLSNILPLWKAFRNVSYLLFVIVFVIMGLAIMFRMKISPQAVITIESALPKIVIALILVTFSYAIAGLLIDLIYVLITLGVALIGQTGWIDVAKEQQKYLSLSFGDGVGLVFGGGSVAVYELLGGLIGAAILALTVGSIFNPLLLGVAALVAILPALIVACLALYAIFKLFLALLMCYINIIISVITAPIQILMGALPGGSFGFGSWIKNLLTNILVFPATAIFLLLGWLLSTQGHGPSWTPPVISTGGDALTKLIGFGMLLMAPKIPEYVKVLFNPKAKVPSPGEWIGSLVGKPAQIGAMGTLERVDLATKAATSGRNWWINKATQAGKFVIGGKWK